MKKLTLVFDGAFYRATSQPDMAILQHLSEGLIAISEDFAETLRPVAELHGVEIVIAKNGNEP